MNRLQRVAILTTLADQLRERESWCGETHLQKAAYFLQELLNVPIEREFILYKHGPFSFDLRDEMAAMCADGLLRIQPQPTPYGPTIVTTPNAKRIQERFPKTVGQHQKRIDFVARNLADKDVLALEGLATALYVSKKFGLKTSASERAKELHLLKPHISTEHAKAFIEDLDKIAAAASSL